jgi:hypothetical protein
MKFWLNKAARLTSCLAAAVLSSFVYVAPSRAGDAYQWTQFTADGLEARAITQQTACPRATVDGRDTPMVARATPSESFPVLLCALPIPRTAAEAAIEGRPVAMPPKRIDKILLIGDTGCRLKALVLQGCNSMKSWPFRLVADLASEASPDLVLHLGDLIYRERECPASNKSCAGSPFGDNWETWKADFFNPGDALLRAAPWAFVRGNHEDCERAGKGWSRLLSAFPFSDAAPCLTQEPPYSLDLGAVTLAILDVTRAEDRAIDANLAPLFREHFSALAKTPGPLMIAMHKPIYASVRIKDGATEGDNKTLVEAARGGLPNNVQAIFSGHLHTFQALSYVGDFPSQIVAGVGGDVLDPYAPQKFDGLAIGDMVVDQGRTQRTTSCSIARRSHGFSAFSLHR